MSANYAVDQLGFYFPTGIRTTILKDPNYVSTFGIENEQVHILAITPLEAAINNIALAQTTEIDGELTLTAGAGVTNGVVKGFNCLLLDIDRAIQFTGVVGTQSIEFVIDGFDRYENKISESVTISADNNSVFSKKTFAAIYRITAMGETVGTVSVGTTNIFGLPYKLTEQKIVKAEFGSCNVPTYLFMPADQNPSTLTTGDVRGKVMLPFASDGVTTLFIHMTLVFGNLPANDQTTDMYLGFPQYSDF
jgi:hypothetical protein